MKNFWDLARVKQLTSYHQVFGVPRVVNIQTKSGYIMDIEVQDYERYTGWLALGLADLNKAFPPDTNYELSLTIEMGDLTGGEGDGMLYVYHPEFTANLQLATGSGFDLYYPQQHVTQYLEENKAHQQTLYSKVVYSGEYKVSRSQYVRPYVNIPFDMFMRSATNIPYIVRMVGLLRATNMIRKVSKVEGHMLTSSDEEWEWPD